ncbi:2-phosphoxylose phosphatase 1-like [Artemia franciscana]|uniref:2-phosphoxylose phosphatase 1-like n=1 Tax=Artemia franciscana TaxID=6661 RepID=UPI0032DA3410
MTNTFLKYAFFVIALIGSYVFVVLQISGSIDVYAHKREVTAEAAIHKKANEAEFCSSSRFHIDDSSPFSLHCEPIKPASCPTKNNDSFNGFKFIGALIVFRHGARGPLSPLRNLNQINCNQMQSQAFKQYTTFLKDFITAGHFEKFEGPFLSYPALPLSSKCSLNDLTSLGVSQLISVGKLAGQRISQSSNISEISLKAFSTRYRRTVQSLWAFLYGFIGENNMSSMQVNVQQNQAVTYCEPYCKCDLASQLESRHDLMLTKLLGPAEKSTLKRMAHILYGTEGAKNVGTRHVKDGILTHICHNITLPCSVSDKCINNADIATAQSFLTKESRATLSSKTFKQMALLKAYGIIQRIMQFGVNSLGAHKKSESPMFFVYSGHDMTLEPLLSTLSVYGGVPPSFATNLLVEYYVDGNFEVFLKFVFNAEEVTENVAYCDDLPCSLYRFKSNYENGLKHVFGTSNFLNICNKHFEKIP